MCTPNTLRALAEKIEREADLSPNTAPYLVAVDGRCAAGKTSFANLLAEEMTVDVIVFHLDDFFLRPCQRLPQRLSHPGRNLDYERVLAELLLPLKRSTPFAYRPFLCGTQSFGAHVFVKKLPRVALIEGSYACIKPLRDQYDLRLFLDVTAAVQQERLKKRESTKTLPDFFAKWIPLEEAYLSSSEDPRPFCRYRFCFDQFTVLYQGEV